MLHILMTQRTMIPTCKHINQEGNKYWDVGDSDNRSVKIKQVAQLTIPNAQGPPQHFWPPRQQHASQKIASHGIPYLKRRGSNMTWQGSAALPQSAPNLHADNSLRDLEHFGNSDGELDLVF